MSWKRGRIFCIDSVTEISMNLRNDRESKDWGISKALTSIYIDSQIYTRHVPFHTENCFFHIYSSIHLERKTV